jgi:hypothetical protein
MTKNATTTLHIPTIFTTCTTSKPRKSPAIRVTVVPHILETPSIVEIPENDNDNNTEDTINQLNNKITLLEAQKIDILKQNLIKMLKV